MFGSLLSGVVKLATLPIDIVETTTDVMTGGDGTKESFDESGFPRVTAIRDEVCDRIKEIDD